MEQVLILEAADRLYYWNIADGTVSLLGRISGDLNLTDIAVLEDGRVFGVSETTLYEINLQDLSATALADLGENMANGLAASADGTLFVTYGAEAAIREFDADTGEVLGSIDTGTDFSLGDVATDGEFIYFANQAQRIDVYDIATGDLVSSTPHGLGGTVLGLSYNDGLIAYADQNAYRLSDDGSAELVQELVGMIAPVFGAAAFLGEVLLATSGADTLVGDVLDNSILALGGDDTITGGGGNDTIDGGTGTDTVIQSGDRASYSIEISADGVSVEDRRGTDGMDFLTEVETISFADQDWRLDRFDDVAALSPEALTQFVEMYIAYFDRAPDAEGLFFWGDALNNGIPLETIAALFFDQDETRALYPDTTTTGEFVQAVYDNVLGRDIDQLGFDFWVGVLDSGDVSRATFMLDIIAGAKAPAPDGASQEFIDQKAADIEYLSNKTDLGTYFSVILGMSDVDNANSVMDLYDGTAESITAAQNAIDGFFADAQDADSGEFLLSLVGVVDDPFMLG